MQLLPKILLICGLSGILTSTVYLLMVMAAVIRFRRRPEHSTTFTPPVSLLKPLHGAEPGLRDYLEGFFLLDYPQYEILFCARHSKDRQAIRLAWLYPVRDLLGFILWAASYASRRVSWRDDIFELKDRGLVQLVPVSERSGPAKQKIEYQPRLDDSL